MFKRKSPSEHWEGSSSRLGWSVLDERLVQARLIREGKKLQLRFRDDGAFPFPDGVTPEVAEELIRSERWQLIPVLVEVQTSGTLVASHWSEMLGYTLHNRHAELVLYRIAHGTLNPDDELVETLNAVPRLREELKRVDLERLRYEVPGNRKPSKKEFGETSNEFMLRETQIGRVAAAAQAPGTTQEAVAAAVVSLNAAIDDNPFRLDDAPYLRR